MANLNYDENDQEVIDPSRFTPLPAGKYEAMIIESDTKPCQTAPMDQLVLVWQIIGGEYAGRKIYDRINMRQEGTDMGTLPDNYKTAIKIGQQALNTIFVALGFRTNDSSELHDKPCVIDVRIKAAGVDKKSGKSFNASNEIKNYLAVGSEAQAAPSAPAPGTQSAGSTATKAPPAKAAPTKMPWKR